MTSIILYLILYYLCCVAFFNAVQRPLFLFLNRRVQTLDPHRLWLIYRHGFRTDTIASAYLTALPVLMLWVASHTGWECEGVLTAYCAVVAVVVALVSLADAVLYGFWESKMDASVFAYLRHPVEAFASVTPTYLLVALLGVAACAAVAFGLLMMPMWVSGMPAAEASHTVTALSFLLIALLVFAIIRGVTHRPYNPNRTCFSNTAFYNHAALNPLYNMVFSFSTQENFGRQFQMFDRERCEQRVAELFRAGGAPQMQLLNTTRPNILIIIWESLCAQFIGSMGGVKGVMPNFDRLADEGVLFTRCDAGSFRTERALLCTLSGLPGQPTANAIRHTRLLPHLPALPRRLRDEGYTTLALHGGNCSVFSMGEYFYISGHDTVVSIDELPKDAPRGQWGVHDRYTFDWLLDDIMRKTQEGKRWLTTYLTLSSHEPFDVPYSKLDDKICNAYAYVDDCFGRFIDRLKASPAWHDTLVVVLGDHGCHYPLSDSKIYQHHIPLLLLGGAVKQPMRIDTIMSQTDLAATLLGQLGMPHDEFIFSRDVLADTYTYPFSLNSFPSGFRLCNADGATVYDIMAGFALSGHDEQREEDGKIILQKLYATLAQLDTL